MTPKPPGGCAARRWCPNCRRMLENLIRTVSGLRILGDRPSLADEFNGEI